MMKTPEETPGFGDKVKEFMDRLGVKKCEALVLACKFFGMGENSTCEGRRKTLNERSAKALARARSLSGQKKRISISEK